MSSTLADWARFPEDNLVLPASRREAQHFGLEPWLLGSLFAAAYLAFGIWIALELGVIGDTLARTANAHFVLFGRDPHLGAIGFVWNPLPSLLSIPLVALKELWPPLVERGIAASVVSAVFGGISVVYMIRILRRLLVKDWARRFAVIGFATNPAVVYYSANGMTEMMLIASLLAALDGLLAYLKDRRAVDLVKSGAWLVVGFGARYETVPWAMFVVIVLAIGLTRVQPRDLPEQRHREWVSGFSIVLLAPLAYAISTWLFLNWAIMGDALYFLTSSYGNASQTAISAYDQNSATAASGDPIRTLRFGLQQIWLWPPVVLAIAGGFIQGIRGSRERNAWALMLFAALVSIPLFQLLMVFQGASAGWVRFFLPMIPFGYLMIVYSVRMIRTRSFRRAAGLLAIAVLVSGHYFTYQALQPSSPLAQEDLSRHRNDGLVASYLDERDGVVLTDTFLSYPIVLQSADPEGFLVTSDRQFPKVVEDPATEVDAILVPEPTGLGQYDAINSTYPSLWAEGAEWAELVTEFETPYEDASPGSRWRLYEVTGSPDET